MKHKIKRGVLYIEDNRCCDFCDGISTVAVMETLNNFIFILCKKCMKELLKRMK